ncbi:hypothetical protein ACO0QE_001555 [Hanseniaspora vineae]
MCILMGKTNHPDYSLILISNRDEVFERETETAALRFDNQVVCSIDKLNGGTWLGVNVQAKKFAVVLNVQTDVRALPNTKSRGALPMEYLLNPLLTPQYPLHSFNDFAKVYPDIENTRHFSLVCGYFAKTPVKPTVISVGDDNLARSREITEETDFVLTNNRLDQDFEQWPKYELGLDALKDLYKYTGDKLIEQCLEISTRSTFPALDFSKEYTFPESKQFVKQSIFIPKHKITVDGRHFTYGTRTTTVILVNRKTGSIDYIEHDNTSCQTKKFHFI